ncbi:MAG: ATP-binding protein [Formosimonas sp.]
MRASLQKKLFLAFFATTAILVVFVAAGMHYVMRDGFDDYVAHVKLQRMEPVERVLVEYIETIGDLSVLQDPKVWQNLVATIDAVKREENANRKPMDKREPEVVNTGELPPYARGVALLDAQGRFVAGDAVEEFNSLRTEIKNRRHRIVGYWLIRKGPPENDILSHLFIQRQLEVLSILLGIAAVLSIILAWLLATHFKKPMARLQTAFRQVAAGRLETRLPSTQTDELGEIARHFNVMTAQLEAQARARQQWVSDTSHELRTPLTILRMRNEAMRDGIIHTVPEEWQRNLTTINDLTKLVDDLQAVARGTESGWDLHLETLPLQKWLHDVVQDHQAAFEAQGLTLSVNAPQEAVVQGDVQRLTQVLRNVLLNSLRYTDTPGQTIVALSHNKQKARIVVSDSAPAVSDAALGHLFERFYRVETSRNRATGGSGLGLAICEGIIQAHGGQIRAAHSEIGGLSIIIELPLIGV